MPKIIYPRIGRAPLPVLIACFFLAVFVTHIAAAQDQDPTAVSVSTVDNMLAKIAADTALSESQKSRNSELLELIKARLNSIAVYKNEAAEYRDSIETAAAEQDRVKQQLLSFAEEPGDLAVGNMLLSELELLSATKNAELTTLQARIGQIDSDIKAEKSLDISQAIQETRDLSEGLGDIQKDPVVQSSVFEMLDVVTRNMQQAQISSLEQRQLSRGARLSLLETEKLLLLKSVERTTLETDQLRSAVSNNRLSYARQQAVSARSIERALATTYEPISSMATDMMQKADDLVALVVAHDRAVRRLDASKNVRQQVTQRFDSLTEQLETSQLSSSPEFGAALRRLRDQLATGERRDRDLAGIESALTGARIAQFQVDELLTVNEETLRKEWLTALTLDGTDAPESLTDVNELLSLRTSLLNDLSESYTPYIRDVSQLASIIVGTIDDSERFATELDQHLLWMPSAPPMTLKTLLSNGPALAWFLQPDNWLQVVSAAVTRFKKAPFPSLIALLFLGVLLWARPLLKQRLREFAEQIQRQEKGRFSLSIRAFVVTTALAIPIPFALLAVAGIIDQPGEFSAGFAQALQTTALVVCVLTFIFHTNRDNGLAQKHFNWADNAITALKRNVPWFLLLFAPMVLLSLTINTQGSGEVRDSLGRSVFVAVNIILAVFMAKVFSYRTGVLAAKSSPRLFADVPFWNKVLYLTVCTLPLLISCFSIAGYHYTAIRLSKYMFQSWFAVLIGLYLYGFARLWFSIGERRLAMQSDLAKEERERAKTVDHETDDKKLSAAALSAGWQDVDLKLLRSQTNVLLKTLGVVYIGVFFWKIWSDFAPAFKPLENVRLWSADKVVDGAIALSSVTVFDVLLAIFVAFVTYLAAKNIPALIEVALRNRRNLEPGASYAITSVSRYLLVIIGTVITLQLLGAQWSKLQWLVAALSVGLGFGLQEIVANFVSGIVILFERPIRIGDTVTVGDQWGTVNKIRIRATTLLDWDRRELIIPNKTFITERLVNWTLTDPITRTTIRVGVAYGSDVELVEKLLVEISANEEKVLNEPAPTVLFKAFGESSLDFEIRVYVRGVHDLIPVAHHMHKAIDRQFRQHGIEISFPQRDLHFDGNGLNIKIIDERNEAN